VNNQTQTRAKTLHLLISSYAVTKNYAEKLQKALWYLLIIMRPTVTTVKNWLETFKMWSISLLILFTDSEL